MRSFAILAAPLLANLALAQDDDQHTTTLTIGYTNSAGDAVTAVTTYTYEYANPATSLLTQTDSDGIITGLPDGVFTQPAVETSQPAAVTSQPSVDTIPAGLPTGMATITLPAASGTGATSFTVSVGSSTTEVLAPSPTSDSDDASGTGSATGTDSSDGSDSPSSTDSDSSSSSETPGAAAGVVPASFGLVSFGALIAALL